MTIRHHPSDESLLFHVAGSLGSGPALAVAIHVAGCARCQAQVADFETIGGVLLEKMPPELVEPTALTNTLQKIASSKQSTPPSPPAPLRCDDLELPLQMSSCGLGPWRWLGPGMKWRRVTLPWDSNANVLLLKVAAGRSLPWHTHTGTEFTQVLHGSFSHHLGRYLPGDMDEADGDIEHRPIVDQGSDCISLAALDGDIRIRGRLGRALKYLFGF